MNGTGASSSSGRDADSGARRGAGSGAGSGAVGGSGGGAGSRAGSGLGSDAVGADGVMDDGYSSFSSGRIRDQDEHRRRRVQASRR